jgi:hypothetical protein
MGPISLPWLLPSNKIFLFLSDVPENGFTFMHSCFNKIGLCWPTFSVCVSSTLNLLFSRTWGASLAENLLMTDGQLVHPSLCRVLFWAHDQILQSESWHLQSLSSGERMGLSFVRNLCHIYMVFTFSHTLYTEIYYFVCLAIVIHRLSKSCSIIHTQYEWLCVYILMLKIIQCYMFRSSIGPSSGYT